MKRSAASPRRPATLAGPRPVDYLPFTIADPVFYDVPWVDAERDRSPRVSPPSDQAPHGWEVSEVGPWTAYRGPVPLPTAGWKVHVSTVPTRAREVVARALRICWAHDVAVKALRTRALVEASQQKYASVASSGKVVTAYPADEATLVALVRALADALAGEPGPSIPGEHAISGAPVFLRFGAFHSGWLQTRAGMPVPAMAGPDGVRADRRGPGGSAPQPPTALQTRLLRSTDRLEVSDVCLLHRSAAGGVFRATTGQGRPVVLKQARRYAGLDAAGVDATTRLRHEAQVLARLHGTGAAPELLDRITLGDSEFLVMEHVPGATLSQIMATRHPGHCPDATPASARAYRQWVDHTLERLTALVHLLAEHGVAHGDLHPSNVIDTGDRVVLIDFESAALDGRQVATGITARGFGSATTGLGGDLAALDRLHLTLLSSAASLLSWRPELRPVVEASGWADLHLGAATELPPGDTTEAHPGGPGASSAELSAHLDNGLSATPSGGPSGNPRADTSIELITDLVAGIRACATPRRRDRLFPGDIATFARPDAGLGLLHGAAGVLLALRATGAEPPPGWVDWLAERALDQLGAAPTGGLAHGDLGVAVALARLDRCEAARAITRQALRRAPDPQLAPWWTFGTAGRALAAAELARLLDLPEAGAAAQQLTDGALQAIHAAVAAGPAQLAELEAELGHAPGLLRGWAGSALSLTRLADRQEPARRAELLASAVAAVRLDARHTRLDQGVLTARHGPRLLPYLGVGSAAIGLAAHCLLERLVDTPFDLDDPAVAVPSGLADLAGLRAGVLAAGRVPQVVGAGLLDGRAGLLAVLRRVGGQAAEGVARHTRRLGWHAVPLPGHPARARALTGIGNHRLSVDLGTGSAGALVALSPGDPLSDVLGMPPTRPCVAPAGTPVVAPDVAPVVAAPARPQDAS